MIINVPKSANVSPDTHARDEVLMLEETDADIEQAYCDSLNDVYGTVDVCGYTYDAGYALQQLDPTAFRCGVADWSSEMYVEVDPDDFPEVLPEG